MWDITSGLMVSLSHTFGFCSELLTYSKHVYHFFFFLCLQPYEVGSLNLSTHLLPTTRTWATERLNGGLEVVAFPQQPTLLPLPEWNYMGPHVLLEQTRGSPCRAAWHACVTVCSMVWTEDCRKSIGSEKACLWVAVSFEPEWHHIITLSYSPADLESSSLNLCLLLSNSFTFRYDHFIFKIKFWAPKSQTWKIC